MRVHNLHPERTSRLMVLLRELRAGDPVELTALADAMHVSRRQLRSDIDALRDQGCLIDEEDGYVRMIDDHLPTALTDSALTVLCAMDEPATRARLRRAA